MFSIVIPQKRKTDLTQSLVHQIRHHERQQPEILVINDDPEDRPQVEKATVLKNKGTGFTSACITGVEAATGGWIVLLNNDVICTGPFLEKLSDGAKHGISGPRLRRDRILKREILQGWCLCFHRNLWSDLGGMDASFVLYFSDSDLQKRALDAGLNLRQVDVPLRHMQHKTAHDKSICPSRHKIWTQDRARFLGKHG